jgi:peptidoglycan-associated lipoprotein
MRRIQITLLLIAMAGTLPACKKNPPVTGPTTPANTPAPFPGATTPTTTSEPNRPTTIPQPPPVMPNEPPVVTADPLLTADIEKINKESPLKAVLFAYDSDALDDAARKAIADNAEVLKKYATWVITIEGHCDERGTAEYNLSLGDRRALAAKNYLVTLGIPPERVKTVSYGSEFPFDPGHDERAWSQNRRAHFMLTARSK